MAARAAVPGDLLEVEIRTADRDLEVHVYTTGNAVGMGPDDDGGSTG